MSRYHQGRFDPAIFNVPPVLGAKGTSQRLQFYVQSAHARALDLIAHSGHFPWGKDTDVARWAIQHGLQYIDEIDPGVITSVMRQANIVSAMADEDMRCLKFIEMFDKMLQTVNTYRGQNEPELAKGLVMRAWREILAMPDEPEREGRWKKKYQDRFEQMFKDLIDY